jgi:curved DNA-binding protein CbpA
MVTKADPKRNYYADLEISPSATTDDIKKQFRKLARLYHPDRNQGKELEFVPKFQAIQAAHEILGDADQRVKYDADRKKLGYAARPTRPPFPTAHTSSGRTAPPRSSAYTSRQHWESTHSSQPPHAPNPPPRPQTHPTRPSWYGAPQQPQSPYTASHAKPSPSGTPGATRFKEFRPPPPPRGPAPNNDSDMRSNVFSAWQSMHNKGAPKTKTGTTPSTPGSEDERRARDQGPFGKASTASPGIRRSNTTRTPRKGGFDPNLPGDFWEPPAQRTSSYTTRHSFAMPGGQTPPSDNSGASQGSSVEQERAHQPQKRHSDHGLRTTTSAPDGPLFGERLSTPYQSSGGEKLNPNKDEFRRSASVRDATRLGARFEVPESSPSSKGATPRAKSASPKDKGARRKSHQPHVIDLTDSSESSDASKPPNISLRPKAQPSRRWKSPTKNNIPIS